MTDYKRYVILLVFDNTIKGSKEFFPFLMSGTDLNNALRHFLNFECGIPFHKTDNFTILELVSKIPQTVLSIYELKPDNMVYFGDNKNEPTNKDEPESIKDIKTTPVLDGNDFINRIKIREWKYYNNGKIII